LFSNQSEDGADTCCNVENPEGVQDAKHMVLMTGKVQRGNACEEKGVGRRGD
jgi:hypothetical protein